MLKKSLLLLLSISCISSLSASEIKYKEVNFDAIIAESYVPTVVKHDRWFFADTDVHRHTKYTPLNKAVQLSGYVRPVRSDDRMRGHVPISRRLVKTN